MENGTTHLFATAGSKTERRGWVIPTSPREIRGLRIALVGDVVSYPDGSQAVITDGAGYGLTNSFVPYALVGSGLSNGDRVATSLLDDDGLFVCEGETIEGLFDPAYVVPSAPPRYRLAVRGSTTARGGVLRDTTGWWKVDAKGSKQFRFVSGEAIAPVNRQGTA
ncbi:conserved hypothetical protein [Burkholderia sp. 8Y]|uniref:PAAR domain-containing protein n=1 Tax=Burkholderia sp. 8Y TaxID=2653133 RepID=UPI0012EFDC70|nr:PAAR domain-containing protein [Burkholderia sp. 8Y]VXC25262.1 conserved hypothetical protein [Burkholderia sp. 8Y]